MTVLEAVTDQLKLMFDEKDLVTDTSKFADKLRSEEYVSVCAENILHTCLHTRVNV